MIEDPTYLGTEPMPIRIHEYAEALAREVYGISNPDFMRLWGDGDDLAIPDEELDLRS